MSDKEHKALVIDVGGNHKFLGYGFVGCKCYLTLCSLNDGIATPIDNKYFIEFDSYEDLEKYMEKIRKS